MGETDRTALLHAANLRTANRALKRVHGEKHTWLQKRYRSIRKRFPIRIYTKILFKYKGKIQKLNTLYGSSACRLAARQSSLRLEQSNRALYVHGLSGEKHTQNYNENSESSAASTSSSCSCKSHRLKDTDCPSRR